MTITHADYIDSIYERFGQGEMSLDDALRELEQMGLDPETEANFLATLAT